MTIHDIADDLGLDEAKRPRLGPSVHTALSIANPGKIDQAVVRVISHIESRRSIASCIQYIANKAEKGLEDQDGNTLVLPEDYSQRIEDWSLDFEYQPKREEKIKISFRMEGDSSGLRDRVKRFGKENLSGYLWRVDRAANNTITLTVSRGGHAEELPSIQKTEAMAKESMGDVVIKASPVMDSKKRNLTHMILSSPAGSSPSKVLEAARRTFETEFKGNGFHYVFGLHTDTKNPHVHIAIKTLSDGGKKLRIGKARIMEIRKTFAMNMRSQGIKVEASYRQERGQGKKAEKNGHLQLRQRLEREAKVARKPVALTNYQKIIKSNIDTELSNGSYQLSSFDERQMVRNTMEREALSERAKYLKRQSFAEKDSTKKCKLIAEYKIFESAAKKLPKAKSRMMDSREKAGLIKENSKGIER